MLYLFYFILGLVVGRFLYGCIDRLPKRQPIVLSHAYGHCHARLQFWDLVPLLGYLKSHGRCRHCGISVAPRQPIVELLTGLMFILCLNTFGFSEYFFKSLIFTCFMIVIAFIDYEWLSL